MDVLCCPECDRSFRLDIYRYEDRRISQPLFNNVRCEKWCSLKQSTPMESSVQDCIECYQKEIVEGKLTCEGCQTTYPVVAGIPRILSPVLLAKSLMSYHPDFLARHKDDFSIIGVPPSNIDEEKKIMTLRTFSYQWTTFKDNFDYFKEIFLSFIHPFLGPDDFKDKLVLELGCGSGRPASVAASFGSEVFAMDLGEAVQTAYNLTEHYPMLHIVQADIYAIPLRPGFDFVYSVGVIQHLPNPSFALKKINNVVAHGHRLVIWVYGKRELWYRPVDLLRKFTTKLSFRSLHRLSIVLAAVSTLLFIIPYRILSKTSAFKGIAEKIPGRFFSKFPFKENVLGWFDRLGAPQTAYFTKDEVEKMLYEGGFRDITVTRRQVGSNSWVAQGYKREVTKDD